MTLVSLVRLLSILVSMATLAAQQRSFGSCTLPYVDDANGDGGMLSMDEASSALTWTYHSRPSGSYRGSRAVDMPFDLVGGIAPLGGRQFVASGLVVGGIGTGTGRLVRFELSPPTDAQPEIHLIDVVDLGMRDPQRVLWRSNDSLLYVLDRMNLAVIAAPYSGAGHALPGVGDFHVAAKLTAPVAKSVQLLEPPIAAHDRAAAQARASRGRHRGPRWEHCWGPPRTRILARREDSRDYGPNGDGTGVAVLVGWTGNEPPKTWLHVFQQNGSWTTIVMPRPSFAPPGTAEVWQTEPAFPNVSGPIYVHGRTGAYEVVDELSGAVVSTGTTQSIAVSPLAIPDAMVPGLPYVVRDSGSGSSMPAAGFVPLIRHGAAVGTIQIQTPKGTTAPIHVGDATFSLIDHVRLQSGYSGPAQADVYLWVCARQPSGADPMLDLGRGVMVLDPGMLVASSGPQRVSMEGSSVRGSFVFELPIPADDQLAGAVILFQYLAVHESGIAISEVFGATILAAGDVGAFAQRMTAQTRHDGGARPTAANNAALARWLSNGAHAVDASRRAEAAQLLARLRQSRAR